MPVLDVSRAILAARHASLLAVDPWRHVLRRVAGYQSLPFADGTRVRVDVAAEEQSRKGSPAALLRLAGTLTPEEADAILKASQECRRVDESLWANE